MQCIRADLIEQLNVYGRRTGACLPSFSGGEKSRIIFSRAVIPKFTISLSDVCCNHSHVSWIAVLYIGPLAISIFALSYLHTTPRSLLIGGHI